MCRGGSGTGYGYAMQRPEVTPILRNADIDGQGTARYD